LAVAAGRPRFARRRAFCRIDVERRRRLQEDHFMSTHRGPRSQTTSQPDERAASPLARAARLTDVGDCRLAASEPDPRGWHVLTAESLRVGEVLDLLVDLDAMRVCYLEVELDRDSLRLRKGVRVLVPTGSAWFNDDEEIVRLPLTASQLLRLPAYDPLSFTRGDWDALRRRDARRRTAASDGQGAAGMRRRMTGELATR
jgi:hypothetical protein